jgi:cytochrome c oxidase subunit 3
MTKQFEETQILNDQRKKIHPHKFTLWIAIGSIVMMFAGLTSAYVVKRQQPGWTNLDIPQAFWFSTLTILVSSLTLQLSLRAFRERPIKLFRRWLSITAVLGLGFITLQAIGFYALWSSGVTFHGSGEGQFLYVIAGLHALHVLAGIIALIVTLAKAFSQKIRSYDPVPLELVCTFWHFVDFLWIYLFIFFLWIR